MAKAVKKATPKKAALKKRAANYEPKVITDLSFGELIAMSVEKASKKEETKK